MKEIGSSSWTRFLALPTSRAPGKRRRSDRRGAALVIVLILLVAMVAIIGTLVYMLLAEHRQLRGHDDQLQAMWLVESGLQRASAQLVRSADYPGETWTVSAEDLGGEDDGSVEILVQSVEGDPNVRRVQVTAHYPVDSVHRKRHSRRITIGLTNPGDTR
jgi:Tfp pilus assembly protein PilX